MTLLTTTGFVQRGLPQLRGRLLWAYRIGWALLAAATLAVLAGALLDSTMQPAILGLRLIKSVFLVTVAVILFWRRQRDPVAAILALAFLCWTITSSVDFTSSAVALTILDRVRFLLFALALLLFPDGMWRPRWTPGVAALSSAVFVLGILEAVDFLPTRLFLPFAIACVIGAIVSLVVRFRTNSSEMQQQQLKWVALGLVSGVGMILSARAGAAVYSPSLLFEAMFQCGIVLVALGFLVPLLRYRLYDAEAVISRSAAYAVLTAALVATFAGSEALIETLGQKYLGSGIGNVSAAMAAAVAAVLLTPLNNRISNWAEQRFQRDLLQLKQELPELLSEVPANWSPRQVGEVALSRIFEAVHATRAALVVGRRAIAVEGATLQQALNPESELFPLRLPLRCPFGGVRGWLMVGPRPDGSLYGADELEVLHAILPALRRTLADCIEREMDRRRALQHRRAIQSHLAEASARIDALERSTGSMHRASVR